jgi:hypothetical protein
MSQLRSSIVIREEGDFVHIVTLPHVPQRCNGDLRHGVNNGCPECIATYLGNHLRSVGHLVALFVLPQPEGTSNDPA